ncbi:MAG: SH3 domain-containing protein [Clostridia bacterium]|nr:SH3 domain-containing protein [Clostridia bacterium]
MKKLVITMLLAALLLTCLGGAALAVNYVHISKSCHVRTYPGTWNEDLGIVNAGSTLDYRGSTQYADGVQWYAVEFNYQDGWVCADYAYLTNKYTGPTTYGSGGSGGSYDGYANGSFTYGANVYINGGSVNVRSGAALEYSPIGTAHSGDVLFGTGKIRADSRDVDWYSVIFEGKSGWVSSNYASLKKGSGKSGGKSSSSTVVRVLDGKDTNVRSGPGRDYSKKGVLHGGEKATYLNKTSKDERGVKWYKISWGSGTGWVSSKYTYLD